MKILFLSTWFPFPLDTGSRIRIYYLLEALTNRHEIDFIAFRHGPDCEAFKPTLRRDWCNRVEIINRDPFWRDPLKNLQGFLSPNPRDVVSGYSQEMAKLVMQVSFQEIYDLVIASVETIAPYALAVKGAPRILEEHNFMSSWTEETSWNRKISTPKNQILAVIAKKPSL